MQQNLITSTRQASPGDTLAAIRPLLSTYDILGFADHTPIGLSLIRSIEVFRGYPRSGYLNLGKGFGLDAALTSGYMEAIEMSIIERAPEVPLIAARESDGDATLYTAANHDVRRARTIGARDAERLLVRGLDLLDGCDIYGYYDELYLTEDDRVRSAHVSTNGLASGNSLAEARLHAVYELIERHVSFVPARRIGEIARLRLETAPIVIAEAIGEISSAGMRCDFFELGRLFDIYVIQCALAGEPLLPFQRPGVNFGWGAHHNLAIAVSRALSEAVQAYATRLACRSGAIPQSRMEGGLLISADELAGLRLAPSSDEDRLYSRLCSSPTKSVPLEFGQDSFVPPDEALARVVNVMRAHHTSHVFSWTLSQDKRPFSVAKCTIPEFRSFIP